MALLKVGCECRVCRAMRKDTMKFESYADELAYDSRMVVCQKCGNKRCPRADHHRYRCTNSNEPDQLARVDG